MREIKFRAWDRKFNIMLESEAFDRNDVWIGGDGKVFEIEEWSGYSGGGKREIDCTEQYILMQYSGLKDKHGQKIYEGDVLHVLELSNKELSSYKSPVEFIDSCFLVIEPNKTQTPLACFYNSTYPLFEIEIIGNIYEHPELLGSQ